jgi:uncharacterized membrane protein
MVLGAFTIALILTVTISYFIIYAEFLKNSIKNQEENNFWRSFLTLFGLSFLGVIILTWFLGALFSCGTDIIVELLETRI